MLIRLFSDSLFNLADKVLNFASIFLSSAIGLQVGAAGEFAGLLLDCALEMQYSGDTNAHGYQYCGVHWFLPLDGRISI